MSSSLDKLYSQPFASIRAFAFDRQVAEVFDDMVTRSVPLYEQIQDLSAELASRFAVGDTFVYDIGCSTGTTLLQLAKRIDDSRVRICGIDNSSAMLAECKKKILSEGVSARVELIEGDIRALSLQPASVIVLNYTLQFISPDERLHVLRELRKSLVPGGIALISEKVSHDTKTLGGIISDLHHAFKKKNGYTELEISQKREALENVLQPLTVEENLRNFRAAGFSEIEMWAKSMNFASFMLLG